MPRPRLTGLMTTGKVARELGMSTDTVVRWMKCGILPPPTRIDNNGVRYFAQEWLKKAREVKKAGPVGEDQGDN